MKEYTAIKVTASNYQIAELLELKPHLSFNDENSTRPQTIPGWLVKEDNGLLIYETQGYYEGIPLSQANQGTKIELYKDWRQKNKVGDGLIHAKYFVKAKRNDWKIKVELNESNSLILPFYMEFSQEEKELLEYGNIPQQMEDKWFSYLENNVIHFLRSWTGIEIFKANLESTANDRWAIQTLHLNNDPESLGVSRSNLFKDLVELRIRRMQNVTQ